MLAIGYLAVFSATIELLQFVKGIGLCELDDVINNTLGTFAGFAVMRWVSRHNENGIHNNVDEDNRCCNIGYNSLDTARCCSRLQAKRIEIEGRISMIFEHF